MNAIEKFLEEQRVAMCQIMIGQSINNQVLVVKANNEEELKALKIYAQNHKIPNLLILSDDGKTTFLSDEVSCYRFANCFARQERTTAITLDLWEVETGVTVKAEDIKKKLESGDLVLGAMSSFSFILNKVSQMRSRWANDIREGFIAGMAEPKRVEYKLYMISSVLQNSIEKSYGSGSYRDKMVLTMMKQELEELIQSQDYQICQELHQSNACNVLSEHVQTFVNQMLELLKEIAE